MPSVCVCKTGDCVDTKEAHQGSNVCAQVSQLVKDEDSLYRFENDPHKPGPVLPWAPDRRLQTRKPLPPTWEAYVATITPPCPSTDPFARTMIRHCLSLPLTILAGLERLFPDVFSGKTKVDTLVIHIIGATLPYEAVAGSMCYEEILHYLPGIKHVRFVLIGPQMQLESQSFEMDVCPPCERAGRTRVHDIKSSIYESLRASEPAPPHLAITFNCGIHDADYRAPWSPALKLLIEEGIPTVFTSQNEEEGRADVKVLESHNAKIIWGGEPNPWRGGRANFDYFTNEWIWWSNGFWTGIEGNKA